MLLHQTKSPWHSREVKGFMLVKHCCVTSADGAGGKVYKSHVLQPSRGEGTQLREAEQLFAGPQVGG